MRFSPYPEIIEAQFGFVYIIALSFIIWMIYFGLCALFGFSIHMRLIGYPSLHSLRLSLLIFYRITNSYKLGLRWFVNQNFYALIIISIFIGISSYLRATHNANAIEFARGGALIVVASLAMIVVDALETNVLRNDWKKVKSAAAQAHLNNIEAIDGPADWAHIRATMAIVVIAAIGTIIWAYGDQILACGRFPEIKIQDQSGVACFKKINEPAQ